MKDFFISYAGADKNWAEWIAWQLEDAGYQVVIQAWDFRPGGNFVLDMQKATAESERTLAVLSPDFLKSGFTQPEWAAAFAKDPAGKKGILVPVRVRECSPDGILGQIIYIDLVGLNEREAIAKLSEGVQKERLKPFRPPTFPAALGLRTVSSLPPFPAKDKDEDEESFIDYLPHPLAAPFSRLSSAKSETDQFVALDQILKNFIKYLTAIALSQYWQDKPDREQLRGWLGSLSDFAFVAVPQNI